MVFNNVSIHQRDMADHWDNILDYDHFVMLADSGNYQLRRMPTESDAEYLFIEGIYNNWKSTGDNLWMQKEIEPAIKALQYCLTSPYHWSEKYQLVKRPYTIDTWPTINSTDASPEASNVMVNKDKTPFGIMFGDNTGTAQACRYLAEMLESAGRKEEAEKYRKKSQELLERLDHLSWNGRFYTHYIGEDITRKYNFGTDTRKQVSMSNAYSINRGISQDKCLKILETYKEIYREKPRTSPAEWYSIYPPFMEGFNKYSVWESTNGGVTAVTAGELARGAFENGDELYALNILHRIDSIASTTGDYLNCTYRGAMPDEPSRNFSTISLRDVANGDIGLGSEQIPGWTEEKDNNMKNFPTGTQVFQNIPFEIASPGSNQQRVCIALSGLPKYKISTCLEMKRKFTSLYLLHTISLGVAAGNMVLHYSDSTTYTDVIGPDKVRDWWNPAEMPSNYGRQMFKIAWRGANLKTKNIGVGIYGFNNPFPDKDVEYIEFIANNNPTKWFILGLTLSDSEVFFMPSTISSGIPDSWGAAVIIQSVIEGLAGIKDKGVAFRQVSISPRWLFDSIHKADVVARYGPSDGYVAYNYLFDGNESKISIDMTGNASHTEPVSYTHLELQHLPER